MSPALGGGVVSPLRSVPVLLWCSMLAVWGCGFADEPADDLEDTAGPGSSLAPASVSWVLDWGQGVAVPLESGWTSVNDLGYVITVEAGWIGSWGATLVACTGELVARGHTTGVDDPSAEVFDLVESLTGPADSSREIHELDGARYCTAHYLLAPISEFSSGVEQAAAALEQLDPELDPELELLGASALILGSWTHPSGTAGSFALRSGQAYGKILTLGLDPDSEVDELEQLDGMPVELLVRRPLDTMFDGVDFELDAADDAAWIVLGNLARRTTVEAGLAPALLP